MGKKKRMKPEDKTLFLMEKKDYLCKPPGNHKAEM